MSHICTQHDQNPVRQIHLYKHDAVIVRFGGNGGSGGKRARITELSEDSLKRLAFVANNTSVDFTEMITLTYPADFPSNGKEVKHHLKLFLQSLRRKAAAAENDLSYLWFLEFQKRGAPHYHMFYAGIELAHEDGYPWVSQRWYEIVDSGDPKHLAAGTRTERIREAEGARHYAVKYASKPHQKRIPPDYRNVGRWWGYSRDVPPEPIATLTAEGATDADVRELLAGWEPGDRFTEYLPRVLYNAAPIIAENALKTA